MRFSVFIIHALILFIKKIIIHALILLSIGALLFFALLGLSGCFITCYDRRVRNDLAQPCRELCLCCCHPGYDSAIYTLKLCHNCCR